MPEHDPKSGALQHSELLRSRGNFDPPDNRPQPVASDHAAETIKPVGKPAPISRNTRAAVGKGSGSDQSSFARSNKRPAGFRKW